MEKEAIFITDPIADYPLPEWLFLPRPYAATGEPVVHNVFAGLRVPRRPPQIAPARRNSHLFRIFRDLFRL
ncbi:hypothetical protein FY133_02530 [Agrobacterium tumefaciens]|jgi:hypothetical protein|uniref:Uncharacterized protein n=1 Tax=Agrobacterium radiobacter TaxID=362 RepID=A0ABD5LB78_AGRRD|nr:MULTISPECIES: hypothetical protein [Agrobacterium]EPR19329.1 hypothetical protein L902_33080 [Agrobacterium radiobacter DSM 30147]KWT89172.1 hypothetical protein ASB65_03420 [Agrobacterium tumefaciens str. B6]MCP2135506.1 hypothetical protein [Rhizobium sp. SLBN-94]TGE82130.1 hypothetical protein C9410_03485 [Rhizobium sp. SEMIA 439]EHH03388.1 hypothetical protein ATCR1_21440 [Agrobacterium tumefaciens CCNWGS0286]